MFRAAIRATWCDISILMRSLRYNFSVSESERFESLVRGSNRVLSLVTSGLASLPVNKNAIKSIQCTDGDVPRDSPQSSPKNSTVTHSRRSHVAQVPATLSDALSHPEISSIYCPTSRVCACQRLLFARAAKRRRRCFRSFVLPPAFSRS